MKSKEKNPGKSYDSLNRYSVEYLKRIRYRINVILKDREASKHE